MFVQHTPGFRVERNYSRVLPKPFQCPLRKHIPTVDNAYSMKSSVGTRWTGKVRSVWMTLAAAHVGPFQYPVSDIYSVSAPYERAGAQVRSVQCSVGILLRNIPPVQFKVKDTSSRPRSSSSMIITLCTLSSAQYDQAAAHAMYS